jgi:hypothetical protein
VVAHLSTDELYNQACLDGTLEALPFSGGLASWNERGVRIRKEFSTEELRTEWEARQHEVRRRWGEFGPKAKILTSVGRYPIRLQVWHLAREYAIHADDIEVPVPSKKRAERNRWRIGFGLYAAEEEGDPVDAIFDGQRVRLRINGRTVDLDPESFIAYLTGRPQQLTDAKQRSEVRKLLESG